MCRASLLAIFVLLVSAPSVEADNFVNSLEACVQSRGRSQRHRFVTKRSLVKYKWSITLCVYQALEDVFDGDVDLSQVDSAPRSKRAMTDLALYTGALGGEQSLSPSRSRSLVLKELRQFIDDVGAAQKDGRQLTLRDLGERRLREAQDALAAVKP